MIHHDYSQLSVMESEQTLKGVVSWVSIGKRLALGIEVSLVQDCMEPAHVVDCDVSVFEAIKAIVQNDYVLVRHQDKGSGG